MNRNEQQTTDANNGINDLSVADDQQAQIKGGPNPKTKRIIVLQSSVTGQDSDLGDLEPNNDVKAGCQSCGIKLNHNETINAEADE